jgi:hypothetical protein
VNDDRPGVGGVGGRADFDCRDVDADWQRHGGNGARSGSEIPRRQGRPTGFCTDDDRAIENAACFSYRLNALVLVLNNRDQTQIIGRCQLMVILAL